MKVGAVGLGVMGGAMAARMLNRGLAVAGYDPVAARCAELAELGGEICGSPAEVAAAAEFVVLSLPSEGAFKSVVIDEAGLAAGADAGLVVVDTSTLPVTLKERGRDALAAVGATLLDCPLSGTGDQALSGDIVVFASGDEAAVLKCAPLFELFSRSHYYVGDFGAGSKMKYIANLLVAIHNVAAAEGLALARAAGLELRQVLEVIADSAAVSRMWEIRGPKMVEGEFSPGIRLNVFEKDLDIISAFARQHNSPAPMLEASIRLYSDAIKAGDGEMDSASVFRRYLGDAADAE